MCSQVSRMINKIYLVRKRVINKKQIWEQQIKKLKNPQAKCLCLESSFRFFHLETRKALFKNFLECFWFVQRPCLSVYYCLFCEYSIWPRSLMSSESGYLWRLAGFCSTSSGISGFLVVYYTGLSHWQSATQPTYSQALQRAGC